MCIYTFISQTSHLNSHSKITLTVDYHVKKNLNLNATTKTDSTHINIVKVHRNIVKVPNMKHRIKKIDKM